MLSSAVVQIVLLPTHLIVRLTKQVLRIIFRTSFILPLRIMTSLLDQLFRLVVSEVPMLTPRVEVAEVAPVAHQPLSSTPPTKSKTVRIHTDTPRPVSNGAYHPPSIQLKDLPPTPGTPVTPGTPGVLGTPATPEMSVSSGPMDLETPENSHSRKRSGHLPMTSFSDNRYETPGDTTMSSSALDSSAELSFGPQDLPFVYHRRSATHPSATMSAAPPVDAHFTRNASFPIIIRRPHDYHEPIPEAPEHKQDIPEDDPIQGWPMSRWRIDQIKYMKRARKGPNQTPRPIPTLHGPLSLPYARNPSGVDATVADESAHMSHVFGLRAASNPTFATLTESSGPRTVSTTESSRSSSGGHAVYIAPKRPSDTTIPVARSDTSKSVAPMQTTMVVRDPYQRIGIKQGVLPPLALEKAKERAKKEVEVALTKKPTPVPVVISRPPTDSTEVRALASMAGTAVPPSAMLRAQINLATPKLEPIPGSPSNEEPDPLHALYTTIGPENGSGLHRLSMSDLRANKASRTREASLPVHMGQVRGAELVGNVAPTLEDPLSVSLDYTHKEDTNLVPSMEFTSSYVGETAYTAKAQQTPQSASKADVSNNWRVKPYAHEEAQTLPAVVLTSPTASPPSTKPYENAADKHQSVMTIDSLFERFGHGPQDKHEKLFAITFNPPNDAVMQETSKLPFTYHLGKAPLGESTIYNVQTPSKPPKMSVHVKPPTPRKSSPAINKIRNGNDKGTPGAGKLLKQPTASAAKTESMPPMPPMPPIPVEANVGGRRLRPARV